jgi:heme/copper-type cytochrome/quinol oxidase subunit 3
MVSHPSFNPPFFPVLLSGVILFSIFTGPHVLAGMVIMAIISLDVRKGRNLQRVEFIGIYWHFVGAVWIFLFPLLYIAR